MVELEDVTLRIGRRLLLDRVSFVCERGRVTGLLGTNGAGKSLVLRIAASELRPSSGSVRIGDLELPRDARRVRRIVGFLPEPSSPPPNTTVEGYLNVAASGHRVARRDRRDTIEQVLALAELTRLAREKAETLSRGEAQRLEIARTLLHDPQVLLLDEPLVGLDPVGQAQVAEILRELARLDRTLVIATNFPELVDDLLDSAVLLHEGRVVGFGDAAQLCAPFTDVEAPTWRAALLRHLDALSDNGTEQAP